MAPQGPPKGLLLSVHLHDYGTPVVMQLYTQQLPFDGHVLLLSWTLHVSLEQHSPARRPTTATAVAPVEEGLVKESPFSFFQHQGQDGRGS